VPRTVGWDVRIMESLERNLFCFGDDLDPGRAPGSLSIHIFMRAEVIRRLGYMGPPQIQHMYVDPVWFAWGKATSIEFLPDVVLEHMHYTISGKGQHDASYEHSTGLIPSDCTNYNDYCDDRLERRHREARRGAVHAGGDRRVQPGAEHPATVGGMKRPQIMGHHGKLPRKLLRLWQEYQGISVEVYTETKGPWEFEPCRAGRSAGSAGFSHQSMTTIPKDNYCVVCRKTLK
jgi:hypothetical protein